MSYPLRRINRSGLLDLDTFAARARLHPQLVRRFITLGLLDGRPDSAGQLWLTPGQLATVARMQRLRSSFGLNYAAVGLVLDLLDRIDELEVQLRRARHGPSRSG